MSETVLEGEVLHESTDLAIRDNAPATLFRTDDPAEVAERAIATADALMSAINQKRDLLISKISGKDYPRVEAWTLLGTMLGVFPITKWTRPVLDEDGNPVGWEARVEARTRFGELVGAAESMCTRSESTWSKREDFALRGMAETRATSRALRKPLGFVMTLAGMEATAAEEMHSDPVPPPVPKREKMAARIKELCGTPGLYEQVETYAYETFTESVSELSEADLTTVGKLVALYTEQAPDLSFDAWALAIK